MGASQEAFLNLLVAAMMDAAVENKLTQLKTTISPDGKVSKTVRIVVIPEEMDHNWAPDGPAGVAKPVATAKDGQNRKK